MRHLQLVSSHHWKHGGVVISMHRFWGLVSATFRLASCISCRLRHSVCVSYNVSFSWGEYMRFFCALERSSLSKKGADGWEVDSCQGIRHSINQSSSISAKRSSPNLPLRSDFGKTKGRKERCTELTFTSISSTSCGFSYIDKFRVGEEDGVKNGEDTNCKTEAKRKEGI